MSKKNIPYKKERVVLSDVLPYETPLTFSNRNFYRFLVKHKIELVDGCISWKSSDCAQLEDIIRLVFSIDKKISSVAPCVRLVVASKI